MLKDVVTVTSVYVDCPKEAVMPFIWDIKNIEYCEVKANNVQVRKESERTGTYTVRGYFMRFIPWQRTFRYTLHERGFHSTEAAQPPSSVDIQGGFYVEATGENRCLIIHYEQYTLSSFYQLLKPIIFSYLKWSQWKEMRDLKALILQKTRTNMALAS